MWVMPHVGCGGGGADVAYDQPMHIAAIFIVLFTSLVGATFPLIMKKTGGKRMMDLHIMPSIKLFGGGVILATGFVHMLLPAFEVPTDG